MNANPAFPKPGPLDDLDARSRDVFRRIVDGYLDRGEATGSRTLSRDMPVSPATIRNVMSDLEHLGLIYAPHVSAGRMPTETGLRMFVDGLMEVGDLGQAERERIESQIAATSDGADKSAAGVLTRASTLLSGLAQGAGVVVSAKHDERLKHVEFVRLDARQALVVLVGASGSVENRIIDLPAGLSAGALTEASNWLNAHVAGHTIAEARNIVTERLASAQGEIDTIAQGLVDQGLAVWSGEKVEGAAQLIVRGRANLLEEGLTNGGMGADLDRLRQLFDELETKQGLAQLLDLTEVGEGVKIFIGSENKLFSLSGSSIVVAPYRDADSRIIGAVGVIGPTRLNYARIVPVVDYTAQLVGRLLYGR